MMKLMNILTIKGNSYSTILMTKRAQSKLAGNGSNCQKRTKISKKLKRPNHLTSMGESRT